VGKYGWFHGLQKIFLFILFGLGGCMNVIANNNPCETKNGSLNTAQCKAEKIEILRKRS